MVLFTRFQVILVMVFLSSCYHNRNLVYLQRGGFSKDSLTRITNTSQIYRLQVNDVLSVKVKSATDNESADIFNVTSEYMATISNPGNLYVEGYSIDRYGKIILPVIGELTVQGLTLEETRELIQAEANKYLNKATVLVKLVSFKITVLGEVKNPGYHYVYNNQISILEALGLAGDLTQFGNRTNIKLIRPTATGTAVTVVDLTDPHLLGSPFFFLMPNDVLYIEPLRARTGRTNLEVWSVIFSAATTAILVLGYLDTRGR
ncbi:polysaccharide biosynthesis/export family protein [Chryseosolibacter histidini]|nr:polysaccharide biosynthesis/export family protein [Chryseosolibacter histidini]